ncbi:MAG: PilZ domain-containing protein [Clostridia bacterium]|nr:PilZ domain-containing protein [Clostridia bacterium]
MLNNVMEKKINLVEVLTKKAKVKFRTSGGNTWYTTTVESIAGDDIALAFPEMFAAIDIVLGDKLICRFTNRGTEYVFEAKIDTIKVQFPQLIKAKVSSDIEISDNARDSFRNDTLFLANVIKIENSEILHSCVRDVSTTGMKLISKHKINEGDNVGVHIALPLRNIFDSVVKLEGKVVWSKTRYSYNEYGIAITQIDELHKDRIRSFLETYSENLAV